VRELVSDPGRAAVPRIAAPLMLPSAFRTASAPALRYLSWLNTDPTRLLCTLRRGRRLPRRNTRYQAGATPYLGRTSTGWIAPASPGAPQMSPSPAASVATIVMAWLAIEVLFGDCRFETRV
jgi:hypothetical protein